MNPACSICGKEGPDLHVFEDGVQHADGTVEVVGSERIYRCGEHVPTASGGDGPGDDLMPHERS